jgi:DNA polymerase-3 subunit epsilon
MRQIVLDTETTGLHPNNGDRIIEIGCIEIVNRRLTGEQFHCYLNPERNIDAGAIAVHGLTPEFLADKPLFSEVVAQFKNFVGQSELIIHNAAFDLDFLDAEFLRLTLPSFRSQTGIVIDTLLEARKLYPGKRNSLDALCERLEISNKHRTLHGALLDAQLLAEVYLAMTRGQNALVMDILDDQEHARQDNSKIDFATFDLPVLYATAEELTAHEQMLVHIDTQTKNGTLWRQSSVNKS